MKRKHAHGSNTKQVKSMLTTARNNFIPDCFVYGKEYKPYKIIDSDKTESLVDEHENILETQQTVAFPTPQAERYYSESAVQQLREENEKLKARVSEAYHKMEVIMRLLEI